MNGGRFGLCFVALGLLTLSAFLVGCSDRLGDARSLEEEGDLAGATKLYATILADRPDDLAALNGMAADLLLLQDYDGALPVQERIVSLDPEDAQTRVELGFNYLNHQGRPGDAVRVFREAAAIEVSAKHLVFLAQAEAAVGQTASAEDRLRAAIETEPSYSYSYRLLRSLLLSQNRPAEAEEIGRQAEAAGLTLGGPDS